MSPTSSVSSNEPSVSGFIAQLVRTSHRYREVTGSKPVEVLTFSGIYTQKLKIAFITAMIKAYLISKSAVEKKYSFVLVVDAFVFAALYFVR